MEYMLPQQLGSLKILFSNNKGVHSQVSLDHFLPQLAVIDKNICGTALQKQIKIALPRGDSSLGA